MTPRNQTQLAQLPAFREHACHSKCAELRSTHEAAPEPFVLSRLDKRRREMGVGRESVRVLDIGCGRGDTVAWLLERGWNAWGADVAPEYLAKGAGYFAQAGLGNSRLRLIPASGDLPFEPASFDVVLSNQVLEHVGDIDAFIGGLAGVSAEDAFGLHVFPAKWRPIEPHMLMPIVHWLPKGTLRDRAIKAMLRVGASAAYFDEYGIEDRAAIFGKFSRDETFYRSLRELRRAFDRHGFECSVSNPSRTKLSMRLPRTNRAIIPVLAAAYRTFAAVYLETVKAP